MTQFLLKNAGYLPIFEFLFFVQPVGIPDDPDGYLLGFSLTLPNTYDMRRVRLMRTAKQALDYAEGKNGYCL